MMDVETATLLTNYNAWADDVLFGAIAKLPANEVYRTRNTLFGSMLGTLNHNYQVDLIWRAHLLGEDHGFSTRRDLLHPEFDGLVKAQTAINHWFVEWAESQNPESLKESVSFRFVSGKHAVMAKGGILLHIINHKTYHRGWVCEMFFDAGAKPPETDLSVYLCEGHSAAAGKSAIC
jgi:uncharacterized damage-inducible protein DinB